MKKSIIAIVITLFVMPCFAKVYGPTKSTDHLWRVATITRPNKSVTIQQTMIGIFKTNSKAFAYGNMNSIKANYYLHIPSLAVIRQIPSDIAVQILHRQNQVWAKMKRKPKVMPKHKVMHRRFKMKPRPSLQAKQNRIILQLARQQMQSQKALLVLQQQLAMVNKAILGINQQYQSRISDLEQNSSTLTAHLQQTNQQVQGLQSRVQQLQMRTQEYHHYLWVGLAILVVILILIILLLIFAAIRRKKKVITETEAEDTKAEYDFMGSEESIPAKLDLARTYIDMDDKKAARMVLKEIIEKGNEEQQQEATKLLEQIKK